MLVTKGPFTAMIINFLEQFLDDNIWTHVMMFIVCVKKQKCAVYKYLIFVPIPKISTRGCTYFMVTSASLPGGSRGGLDTSNHIN